MKVTESKEIILNCEKLERRFVMLRNGRIEAYEIERDDRMPKVGDIYLGKIVNLDPMLQAAFVDIGAQKNAFLHYHDMLPGNSELIEEFQAAADDDMPLRKNDKSETLSVKRRKRLSGSARSEAENQRRNRRISTADIPHIFKPGSEILVQVVKAPISTKGARVTTDISIPGRFLVLMPYCEHLGLSTRIEGAGERDRLRKILADLELPEGMGLICRTVGAGRKANFFKNDLEILLDYWHKIEEDMEKVKAPALLFTEPNLIERSIRDFLTEDFTGVVVDDKEAYRTIISTLKRIGGKKMTGKVHFYNSAVPVYEYYKINDQLREVFQRELHLPGGGAIVIDETEAMIAIDVNSGHGRKSAADQVDFILKTNLEAAEEIARQLRLRDIGGLVVIDFIDMKAPAHRDELCKTMKKLVKNDRAKTKVLPLSSFGLMEMTRQREHESIKDQIFNFCPYCGGSGLVKSAVTMSAEIQRKLNSILRNKKYRKVSVRVFMHPDILARLRNSDASLLQEIEDRHDNDLSFRADPALHYEEFRIVDAVTGSVLV